MDSEKKNKTKEVVTQKVKQTDEQAHKQVQKIKESKIGQMLPTEYNKINTKQVALAALILNAIMYMYTYAMFIALYPENINQSFFKSACGILLICIYGISIGHDSFVYFLEKSGLLLSFLAIRAISLIITAFLIFFTKGVASTWLFRIFIILTNAIFCLLYMYIFSIYISHIKTGRVDTVEDHQEI